MPEEQAIYHPQVEHIGATKPREVQIGDQVLFCMDGIHVKGQLRPATVVKTWGPLSANLVVLTNGGGDGCDLVVHRSSVMHGYTPGHWRWPHERDMSEQPEHAKVASV